MVVLKFGGSSVANAAAIARVTEIVARERRRRVVVVSALGGVTDQLLEAARLADAGRGPDAAREIEALRSRHRAVSSAIRTVARREALDADLESTWTQLRALVRAVTNAGGCTAATRDAIVASGELLSSRLVAAFLAERGVAAAWVDARRVVVTDTRHGEAAPDTDATRARVGALVRTHLEAGRVAVVGGFVGATPAGATTTLGRGGSDYSATLIGACLDAAEVQIWTDTDGVLTADPRVLPQAQTVARLSYAEAAALAYGGAKVLHPATVAPAVGTGIPVRVLNSRRPVSAGTLITGDHGLRTRPLAGMAWKAGRRSGRWVVTVVGDALARNPDLRAAVRCAIGRVPRHLVVPAAPACHLSVVVAEHRLTRVLASLHERFFERDEHRDLPAADLPADAGLVIDRIPAGQEAWA